MLIPPTKWFPLCTNPIRGILHIGAHECEEQTAYNRIGVPSSRVIWVEAIGDKATAMQSKGFNVINAVVSDKDDETVSFYITNNWESSSILPMNTHTTRHPHVHVTHTETRKTTTLHTIIKSNNIDMTQYNFMNLDIQGAELKALKGMGDYLHHIDYIYTEANVEHLYTDCALVHELDQYLAPFGFVRRITDIREREWGWGDVFYVKQ